MLAAVCAGLVVTMAACSSSSNSSKGSSDSSAASAAGPASGSASVSPAIQAVRDLIPAGTAPGATISVGTRDDDVPWEYKDEHGNLVGLEVDLASRALEILGLKAQDVIGAHDTIIPSLLAKRFVVAYGGLGTTPEQQKTVDFVTWGQGYLEFITQVKDHITIKSVDDLCGKTVASTEGGETTRRANIYSGECVKKGMKPIQVQTYPGPTQDLLALKSGRAQIWYGGGLGLEYTAKQSGGTLEVVGSDNFAFPQASSYGLNLVTGSPWTKAWQAAINYMVQDGSYLKILQKWGLTSFAIKSSTVNPPQ
jgi:polar amino acid transport system substrate-binding protein